MNNSEQDDDKALHTLRRIIRESEIVVGKTVCSNIEMELRIAERKPRLIAKYHTTFLHLINCKLIELIKYNRKLVVDIVSEMQRSKKKYNKLKRKLTYLEEVQATQQETIKKLVDKVHILGTKDEY